MTNCTLQQRPNFMRGGIIITSAVMLDELGFFLHYYLWRLETLMHENPGDKWFRYSTTLWPLWFLIQLFALDTCICRVTASFSLAELNSVGVRSILYTVQIIIQHNYKDSNSKLYYSGAMLTYWPTPGRLFYLFMCTHTHTRTQQLTWCRLLMATAWRVVQQSWAVIGWESRNEQDVPA